MKSIHAFKGSFQDIAFDGPWRQVLASVHMFECTALVKGSWQEFASSLIVGGFNMSYKS